MWDEGDRKGSVGGGGDRKGSVGWDEVGDETDLR